MPFNDQFEKSIRDRFSGARMEPSPDLWAKLESKIPVDAISTRKIIPLWAKMSLLAAAAILIFLIHAFATYYATASQSSMQDIVAETPLIKEGRNTTPEPGPVNPIEEKTSPTLTFTKKVNTSIEKSEKPGFFSHNHQIGKANGFDSEIVAYDKGEKQPASFVKNSLQPLSAIHVKRESMDNYSLEALGEINVEQISPIHYDWIINNGSKKRASSKPGKKGRLGLFAGLRLHKSGLSPEETVYTPNPNNQYNQYGGFVDPLLPVQRNIFPQWVSIKEVGAELFVSERLSVQTGIGLATYKQQIVSMSFENQSASSDYLVLPNTFQLREPDNPAQIEELTGRVSANTLEHNSLHIPLDVQYYIGDNKKSLAIQAGVSLQHVPIGQVRSLAKADYDFQDARSTTENASVSEAVVENTILKRNALSGRVGIKAQKHLVNGIHLYIGPTINYAFDPAYNSVLDIHQSRFGIGLEMGLRWQ
ncbi:MAG: hypothetical protein AB8F95_07435 [Bacteroidia bacterium]